MATPRLIQLSLNLVLLGLAPTVGAQMVGGGSTTRTESSGEEFVFETNEMEIPESGLLSEAILKGVGQLVYGQDGVLLTAGEVIAVDDKKLVLRLKDKTWDFSIGDGTEFCEGKKSIGWRDLRAKSVVTVVSQMSDRHSALSVRMGPLSVSGPFGQGMRPIDYQCE